MIGKVYRWLIGLSPIIVPSLGHLSIDRIAYYGFYTASVWLNSKQRLSGKLKIDEKGNRHWGLWGECYQRLSSSHVVLCDCQRVRMSALYWHKSRPTSKSRLIEIEKTNLSWPSRSVIQSSLRNQRLIPVTLRSDWLKVSQHHTHKYKLTKRMAQIHHTSGDCTHINWKHPPKGHTNRLSDPLTFNWSNHTTQYAISPLR